MDRPTTSVVYRRMADARQTGRPTDRAFLAVAQRSDVSDFRQAGLNRQLLNFGAFDPGVAICRSMQLYKCRSSFVFRQPSPPTDTLRKRARTIDMPLPDERGLDVPGDIRHLRFLARSTLYLSSLFREMPVSFGK